MAPVVAHTDAKYLFMSKIVHRTLEVFETFAAQKRPLSLTELSRLLQIPQSSCHDVVQAMQERGYLYEVRPRGGYYPTARLFQLARTIQDNDPVAQRAEPLLQVLSERLNASVSLAKARGDNMVYLLVCNPPDPLRFSVNVGGTARYLHATSVGKCLLGSLEPERRRAVIERLELTPITPHTLTSREALLADIERSEARGWYENCEESVEDALTFSVRFHWNGAVYAITAAGTRNRMERQREQAVQELQAAARQLASAP
jgi:DNA-binding IclR family transcriptional regulator